jgi:hypothetical protein
VKTVLAAGTPKLATTTESAKLVVTVTLPAVPRFVALPLAPIPVTPL